MNQVTIAPRPGSKRTRLAYRLGLPILRGYLISIGGNSEYRRPRRRSRFARRAS